MTEPTENLYKKIPSVNLLVEALASNFPDIDPLYLKRIVLRKLDEVRRHPKRFQLHKLDREAFQEKLLENISAELRQLLSGSLRKVINAGGVVLHTGLGRAPLNSRLAEDLRNISRYVNLEIDLESGKRGERTDHIRTLLQVLSGAEDGLAVNNNAAAVMLMLNSVGRRKEIILSRGEMVEIGGSFRLPEVMRISGCKLCEIGTTNKTHLYDYESAINKKTAAILVCHPSNYEINGFTAKPDLADIVDLAHRHQLPVLFDLGSGSLVDTIHFGEASEPQVSQIVETGVDLISFSGDKLLGGPQAGIIVGREQWVRKCAKNHMLRALRLDKFMLKLLQQTLIAYLYGDRVFEALDGLSALTADAGNLKSRSEKFKSALSAHLQDQAEIVETASRVGSGAYPTMKIPTWAVRIKPRKMKTNRLAGLLRANDPPVITYIDDDALFIDLRTVNEAESAVILKALERILS